MGSKTRIISVAVVVAMLMFFMGRYIEVQRSGGGGGRVVKATFMASLFGGSGSKKSADEGSSKKLSKGQAQLEALRAVLSDDDRAMCGVRYPHGLQVTEEQREFLHSQRYFLVITLRNNEEMLHHALYELLHIIEHLGPRNVFVSVFENNSKDRTPQFLALFTDLLKLAGVNHNLVSTFTIQRELEAAERARERKKAAEAAQDAAVGRRLLGDDAAGPTGAAGQAGSTGAAGETATAPASEAASSLQWEGSGQPPPAWLEAAIEQQLLQLRGEEEEQQEEAGSGQEGSGGKATNAGSVASGGADAAGAGTLSAPSDAELQAGADAAAAAAFDAGELLSRAAAIGAAMRMRMRMGAQGGAADTTATGSDAKGSADQVTARPAGATAEAARGRRLAEGSTRGAVSDPVDSDWAILTEGKWTGNRIEFLAKVRNRSIQPLFKRREVYDRIVFMNDAYFCAEDVIRLALHRDADVACGLDFDTTNAYGVGFYDTWVDRDLSGEQLHKRPPFIQRGEERELLRMGKPFPVFCCWNGVLVATTEPLYDGVRFRRGVPGECAASECSLFCKDYWRHRAGKFAIDPHVRVAYDLPTYKALHHVGWIDSGSPRVTNASRVDWPEDIPWPRRPPERVYCCGLDGNGRDPDQPCMHEEQKLPMP